MNLAFRLISIMLGATILIYLRLLVMDSNPPVFQRMDNPAAFENNTFTKVQYTLTSWNFNCE